MRHRLSARNIRAALVLIAALTPRAVGIAQPAPEAPAQAPEAEPAPLRPGEAAPGTVPPEAAPSSEPTPAAEPPASPAESAVSPEPAPTPPVPAAKPTPEIQAPAVLAPAPPEVVPSRAATATVSAGEGGFSIASSESRPLYVLKLMGQIQADGRFYVGDRIKNNVLLRRVRPVLAGTVLGLVDFYLMPDFGAGQTVLMDAYLDAHPFPWLRLRVGKFKAPIGLERLQADQDMPIAERALTSDLSAVRDVGAQLWGEVGDGVLVYALAVLDGAPDSGQLDLDVGGNKDFAGRLFAFPFRSLPDFGTLGVGIAGTTGVTRTAGWIPNVVGLRTEGQTPLFSYLAPSTDATGAGNAYSAGRHSRLNPELYYYSGPFGLLGEAIWSRQAIALGSASATLTHVAWHVTASWVIGGENGYTGATPKHAFDWEQGHFGALEIGARVSRIVFDDVAFLVFASSAVSAQKAEGLSLAANWVLSRNARLAVDLLHTSFLGGAGQAAAIVNRKPENLMLVRTQVNF